MGLLTAPRPKGMLLMAPDRTEEAEVLFLPSTLPQHHLFLAALEHDQPERPGGGKEKPPVSSVPKQHLGGSKFQK